MEYLESFKNEVLHCNNCGIYIGSGNPNSKILIIGKETATDVENKANRDEHYVRFQREGLEDFNQNAYKWKLNTKNPVDAHSLPDWIGGKDSPINSNPLFPFKSLQVRQLKEGHTWRKYQKLHDLVFFNNISLSKEKEFNFHNEFFLTEMNNSPAKFTKDADRRGIPNRKQYFKESAFFQSFPVVVLACSNYINGDEIKDIFKVSFDRQCGKGKQLFWTHYNSDRPKLVIHTRQLSTNVSNDLLIEIANEISRFLKLREE